MPDEPITNPPTESPAPVDVSPPAPVAPIEAPPTETPASAEATADKPPVVVPEPISAEATMGKPVALAPVVPDVRSLLAKALAKIQFRKQAKLEKIMVLARERSQVANDDVQKLLRVSDATASRYLAQLAKAGRLQRVGHPRNASYKPLP